MSATLRPPDVTTAPTLDRPRLLFVFRDGWSERVRAVEAGDAPAEAYGYFALAGLTDAVGLDSSLDSGLAWKALSLVYQRMYAIPRSGLGYRLHQARAVRRFLRDDAERWVVPTTDSVGLPLLALRSSGALPNPIAHVSIGLAHRLAAGEVAPTLARRYVRMLRAARVVLVFTPAERDILAERVPGLAVRVMPLGIDAAWWAPPTDAVPVPATVLAAGRDPARSFPMLAEAVRGLPVETTIVGSLARRQRVAETRALRIRDDVPIAELRRLLWAAEIVALPSRASAHGAGQSTALQAMAAARPVIMTDTGWAAAFGLASGAHYVGVPPADARALRDAILDVLALPDRGRAIGAAARERVVDQFTTARQAAAILDAIAETA